MKSRDLRIEYDWIRINTKKIIMNLSTNEKKKFLKLTADGQK